MVKGIGNVFHHYEIVFFLIHRDRRIVSVKTGLFFQEITFILDSQVAIFCYQYFKQVANGIFRWQICYLLLLISNPAHGLNRVRNYLASDNYLFKLADNQVRHKLSDGFELWRYCTFCLGVTCPGVLKKLIIIWHCLSHSLFIFLTNTASNLLMTGKKH